jgi:hypothetical protein
MRVGRAGVGVGDGLGEAVGAGGASEGGSVRVGAASGTHVGVDQQTADEEQQYAAPGENLGHESKPFLLLRTGIVSAIHRHAFDYTPRVCVGQGEA